MVNKKPVAKKVIPVKKVAAPKVEKPETPKYVPPKDKKEYKVIAPLKMDGEVYDVGDIIENPTPEFAEKYAHRLECL